MNDDPLEPRSGAALWPPPAASVELRSYVALHLVAVPLVLAVLAWIVQHGRLDMAITRLFVDAASQRFAWHDSVVLDVLGHQAARSLPFFVGALAIAAGLAGFSVRSLRPWTPILLTTGAAMLLGPLAVNALKMMTTQHCPIALQSFGGVVDYVADQRGSFWAASPQSAGHCLPSGHAAGGYALLSLYFAGWAAGRPTWRWRGLAIGIAAGLVFSVVRMMQGAHFASATIWSAAVDWTACAALFLPLLCRTTAQVLTTAEPVPGVLGSARPRLVVALALFAWLAFTIGLHPLTLPEEGRYVGVAWEMLRSGDWIVPTENGLPFFHKPPLFYWLTAASMQVFGTNVAAARFAPLLAACLAAFGFYAVTRRRAGAPVAGVALLVLATMPFFFGAAQFANLDMLVAAFIALAIVFAADAALDLRHGRPHRQALVLAWACAALGVLAKGLIGLVLPGLVVVVWLVVSGQARTILRLVSPLGLAVFALIAAPWFIAVQQQYPGFARYFFIYHHFERFTASGFNNPQPWWFFLVAVPLLTLPWSLWLARSGFRAAPDDGSDQGAWRQLMWTWLASVVVFFSLPESKPVGYVMPVLFPLACLIAEPVLAAWRSSRPAAHRLVVASVAGAVALCLVAVAWMTRYDRDNTALAHALHELRAPGEPIVFVDEYFFDIPLYARLDEPVPVIADWSAAKIGERDNWRRELAEAAPFAPARGAAVLVDATRGYALRCGKAPLWAVVKPEDDALVAAQPAATRVFASKRAELWRLVPLPCMAESTPKPAPSS